MEWLQLVWTENSKWISLATGVFFIVGNPFDGFLGFIVPYGKAIKPYIKIKAVVTTSIFGVGHDFYAVSTLEQLQIPLSYTTSSPNGGSACI